MMGWITYIHTHRSTGHSLSQRQHTPKVGNRNTMSTDTSVTIESNVTTALHEPETAPQNELHKDPDLWFDQGDLVLQAEHCIFRVFKESLAAKSSVFKDMVGFPQSEGVNDLIDGCPVVRLLDDSDHGIRIFLKAIFLPSFVNDIAAVTFEDLAVLMRLCDKYQADSIRAPAIRCLELVYPMTLDDFDRTRYTCLKYPASRVSALARDFNLLWILPSALYRIYMRRSVESIADACTADDLEYRLADEDRRALLHGIKVLGHQAHSILIRHLSFVDCPSCHTVDRCHKGRTNTLRGYVFNANGHRPKDGPRPLDTEHSPVFSWLGTAVCDVCLKWSRSRLQEERKDFWSRLPGIFGLPNWTTLERMHQEAQS